MCMCMHKALGGHSFDALLEASSDLITHFGLLEDYGSFARLLKQFLKILLGIYTRHEMRVPRYPDGLSGLLFNMS